MDILTQKKITNNGEGRGYFRNCVEYPYKEKLEPGEALIATKGYGVCDTNVDYTYEQMQAVKKYYGKIGDNPVMHFVVAFDKKTVKDADTACEYLDKIADNMKSDYQMITAVHMEDQGHSLYHGHIIMNSVDYNTGKLYHSGKKELSELAIKVHDVTGNYCKPEIKNVNKKKKK
ncbi:MAG: relaxase/mobilization nuclease domain-containing protein [Ruminococcus sp.]|nr:relaxase/mobilization nuclease domain-containing protein [Ruminococcus sp.]